MLGDVAIVVGVQPLILLIGDAGLREQGKAVRLADRGRPKDRHVNVLERMKRTLVRREILLDIVKLHLRCIPANTEVLVPSEVLGAETALALVGVR